MLTRRNFLLSSLGLAFFPEFSIPAYARAKKKPAAKIKSGPYTLVRQAWPPAIAPDHVAIVDRGYTCFADEFGHIAIVELKKADSARVIGELTGLGRKLIDFCAIPHRAFAIVSKEGEQSETRYELLSISLSPMDEPYVVSTVQLGQFSEPTCIAANLDTIVIAGAGGKGEHIIAFFATNLKHGKLVEPALLSTVKTEAPVSRLDLQEKSLMILQGGENSRLDFVNLTDIASPVLHKGIQLSGHYTAFARQKNLILLVGKEAGKPECTMTLVNMDIAPHKVSSSPIPDMTRVIDVAAQRNWFLVLGQQKFNPCVQPVTYNRALDLVAGAAIPLPAGKTGMTAKARLSVKDNYGYVAAGTAGAEIISFNKSVWQHVFTFSIPRLPASGVAAWGNLVVLGGADLKVYDITKPEKPTIVGVTKVDSTAKSIAGAGSYILCLSKDSLTLRKMDSIDSTVAEIKVNGQQVAFDTEKQKGYVLSAQSKKTTIYPIQTYSNSLTPEKSWDVDAHYRRLSAAGGYLLLGGLHDVALYTTSETPELVGTRHFENLAIRDIALSDEYSIAAAIDSNDKGFLLVISKEGKELSLLGSTPLPHDAAAVAVANHKAVVVGKSTEGKDMASIIDFTTPSAPKEIASFPVVDAASAIAIKDNLAIVVGRGLEILSM